MKYQFPLQYPKMSAAFGTEILQAMLSCLEQNPPNWYGAAKWFKASWAYADPTPLYKQFGTHVSDAQLAPYYKHFPGADAMQDKSTLFVHAVQLGGFRQELIDALRSVIPQLDQAALLKEVAALRDRVAALEAAMPKQP